MVAGTDDPASIRYFLAFFTAALTMSLVEAAAAMVFTTGFFGFFASRLPRLFSLAMEISSGFRGSPSHDFQKPRHGKYFCRTLAVHSASIQTEASAVSRKIDAKTKASCSGAGTK